MISDATPNSFIKEANEFYKVAVGGVKKKKVFTNEILYNLISISMEKYFMGFLTSRNQLPQCHTLKNMINEMKSLVEVNESIVQKMYYFDDVQQICSLIDYHRKTISDHDINEMISVLGAVKELVDKNLN
ncbi:hypothetical protein OCK74_18525 [Chitinophagaceae bacterium LB-8]|uniref:HEPN domain-containing protein n=1 Tax=Paraflavisolibacter caeni TaxID=2982496 RepID=A0A9X3BIC7_9BACT|nr:hypothetical protein [Paraflavisolibacter caeni]MCU7551122.1 hypothetical protein [Paraflavisolibacter caeni]